MEQLNGNLSDQMSEDTKKAREMALSSAKKAGKVALQKKGLAASKAGAARAGTQAVKTGSAASKMAAMAHEAAAGAGGLKLLVVAHPGVLATIGIIILVLILYSSIQSFASSAGNEIFDIDHYARDEEITKVSAPNKLDDDDPTILYGDTVANTEEEIIGGFQVVRNEVVDYTGVGESSSSSSTTASTTSVTVNGELDFTSDDSITRIVDGAHKLSEDYVPTDLVDSYTINGHPYTTGGVLRMRQVALTAFTEMCEAAYKEGHDIKPISCFRDPVLQKQLYEASGGDGSVGSPGSSEHQTGLAIDLGIDGYDNIDSSDHFEETDAYAWLKANAYKYGFTETMPENTTWSSGWEPWHWRYLGVEVATAVYNAQQAGTCIQFTDWAESGGTIPTASTVDASQVSEYDSIWATCAFDVERGNYEDLYTQEMIEKLGTTLGRVQILAVTLVKNVFPDLVEDWNNFKDSLSTIKQKCRQIYYGSVGVTIKTYEVQAQETEYATYAAKEVDGKTYYVKTGTATTTEEITVDNYKLVRRDTGEDLYEKDGTKTITPNTERVETGSTTVRGFTNKSVFLKSLDVEPNDTYRDIDTITNLEYTDYLYECLLESFDIPLSSSSSSSYTGKSYSWPLAETDAQARGDSLSSCFGHRNYASSPWHPAIDVPKSCGTPVYAATSGTVTSVTNTSGYGLSVVILSDEKYNGEEIWTKYSHLDSTCVAKGDVVKEGQEIAGVGSSGGYYPNHLDYKILLDSAVYPEWPDKMQGAIDPMYLYTPSVVDGYSTCDGDHDDEPERFHHVGLMEESLSGTSVTVSDSDFDIICAIVRHESGGSYESALAVMSCVMNRVDTDGYASTPLAVLTEPNQFESYFGGYYKDFLNGNYGDETKQAVTDCLNGKRNHKYLNFHADQITDVGERIPASGTANWYYNSM